MFFALDEYNNRIYINNTNRRTKYYCPCCGSELIIKMGNIRRHHFAHPTDGYCKDTWHYDMTEWHHEWQNKFPLESQEIVKELDGKKHRADVLLEDEKVVFEFQHSSLSSEEFEERNSFYNALGYKVIWIFDVEYQYKNEQIDNYKADIWYWKRPKKTFDYFDYKNKSVELFLQIDNNETDIIKVTWCTDDNGLSRFATDGRSYQENDIVYMFGRNEETVAPKVYEYKLSELYDTLIKLYSKDHTTYYWGCPISTTHKCGNIDIDIHESDYNNIMPCMHCEFSTNKEGICNKRFLDLSIDGNTIVRIIEKNESGFIKRLSYIQDGIRKYIELPTFKNDYFNDVFTLWKGRKCSLATFRNIKTDKYIRITKDPNEQFKKYGKVYGYFSDSRYSFPKTSCELYGVSRKEWVLEWYK